MWQNRLDDSREAYVDWDKLGVGHRLGIAGGAVLVITLFLPWYGVLGININAFDSGFLAWGGSLIAIAGAVVLALKAFGTRSFEAGTLQSEQIALLLTGLGTLLILLRWITETSLTKFGLFLAIIAGLMTTYGAFSAMREAGLSFPGSDDFRSLGGDDGEGGPEEGP